MSDVARETPLTAKERTESAQRVLQMLGIRDIAVDITELLGQINAIAATIVEAKLVTTEQLQERAQEHRADFLEGLIKNAQTVARVRSNVGHSTSAKEEPA